MAVILPKTKKERYQESLDELMAEFVEGMRYDTTLCPFYEFQTLQGEESRSIIKTYEVASGEAPQAIEEMVSFLRSITHGDRYFYVERVAPYIYKKENSWHVRCRIGLISIGLVNPSYNNTANWRKLIQSDCGGVQLIEEGQSYDEA